MYKYYYRKAYNSGELLIEFFKGTERDGFFRNVFAALSSVHPVIKGIHELWMNDEMVVNVDCDLGNFILSKDIYDLSFIMARQNSGCIEKIDQLLAANPMFERAS